MDKAKLVVLVYNSHRMKKLYEETLLELDGESIPSNLFYMIDELGKIVNYIAKASAELECDTNGEG